jgi:hypothetical protein
MKQAVKKIKKTAWFFMAGEIIGKSVIHDFRLSCVMRRSASIRHRPGCGTN